MAVRRLRSLAETRRESTGRPAAQVPRSGTGRRIGVGDASHNSWSDGHCESVKGREMLAQDGPAGDREPHLNEGDVSDDQQRDGRENRHYDSRLTHEVAEFSEH